MKNQFRNKVYDLCRKIPEGKVATYGQLARLAGKPKAARAVGMYMRLNSDAPHTPCHRVVASNGSLTGYSGNGGLMAKKKMLLQEGVFFHKAKINLELSKWNRV